MAGLRKVWSQRGAEGSREVTYLQSEACKRVQGKNSDWFGVTRGVRQGCTMSPWLFNIAMDNIFREARESFQGGSTVRSE